MKGFHGQGTRLVLTFEIGNLVSLTSLFISKTLGTDILKALLSFFCKEIRPFLPKVDFLLSPSLVGNLR